MLVVLAILGIVLSGLTVLFTSAMRSQTDQTKRVNAQQDVRVALDQLRRELRCGSALAYNSASSVTVTLPSYCRSAPSTTLSANVTLPSATIAVAGTSSFNAGTNTISFGSSGTVTCTAKTPTSFTGCSGGAGTYPSGAGVTSPVTWCVTTSGPPYTLKRYAANASVAGTACTGVGGVASTAWLVSSSAFTSFTRPAVLVARADLLGCHERRHDPPRHLHVRRHRSDAERRVLRDACAGDGARGAASSTSNTVTLNWSAYTDPSGAGATSYRIYGRDNGSTTAEGLRLLATTTATTSYTDTGPAITTLSSAVTLPAATIAVGDTSKFTWSPNTIAFGSSGTVTCTGTSTPTLFTGCTGGVAGTYPPGTPVFQARTPASPSDQAPPLATLNVSLVADQTPADASQRFTLNDAISLRNSGRY